MNNDARLISKIIEDRTIGIALERNVNENWFADVNDKKMFRFLHDHYTNYQECPGLEVINENFPTYQTLGVQDRIDYLIDKAVEARRKASIIKTLDDALSSIERSQDHEGAVLAFERGLIRLEEEGLTKSNDLEITEAAKKAKEEYEFRKANPGLLGLATGFPTMDEATSGLQPGQLIVIVAPPKTGKSTLALQIALNAHLNGKVPMFMSFEMSNAEQKSRYYAMQSKNPDIVFIDGTYLMIDEQSGESNTPQAITNITRSLKRLAQKINKPIVISTQALTWKMKKGQVTADSIGYSSSFHQDADVIFGLQREDENVDDTRLLRVVASRNGGLSEVSLMWDWNTGHFREISDDDL